MRHPVLQHSQLEGAGSVRTPTSTSLFPQCPVKLGHPAVSNRAAAVAKDEDLDVGDDT